MLFLKTVGFNLKNIIFGEVPLSKSNHITIFLKSLYAKQYILQCIYNENFYFFIWAFDMKLKNVCQLEILLRINLMYNGENGRSVF